MCVRDTPLEHYPELGLYVKREDLCCPPPGPPFSKARGVWAHVQKRPEKFIGVLDTVHSQGGWAVAHACKLLGKQCVEFFPVRKGEASGPLRPVQAACRELGAQLLPLPAGRSAVLYHRARAWLAGHPDQTEGAYYMMPNALKLTESVTETAEEVGRTFTRSLSGSKMPVLVSASSGTIAAGVALGLFQQGWGGRLIVHMGYSRPAGAVLRYMARMSGLVGGDVEVVDEGYAYADAARPGVEAPFSCNQWYDLKALRWWVASGREKYGIGKNKEALLWNIG